ncbi:MAG: PAS domain-containing sensor histidine kinase [Calditrichaceae bacterium]
MKWYKKDPLSKIAIKYKLPLSFVLLSLIVFGFGGYFVVNSVYSGLDREIQIRLKSESMAQAVIFDNKLESLKRRAEDFASDGFIRSNMKILLDRHSDRDKKIILQNAHHALKKHLIANKLPLVNDFSAIEIYNNEKIRLTGTTDTIHFIQKYIDQALIEDSKRFSQIIPPSKPGSFPTAAIVTDIWNLNHSEKLGFLVCVLNLEAVVKDMSGEYDYGLTDTQIEKYLTVIDQNGVCLEVPWRYLDGNNNAAASKGIKLSEKSRSTPIAFHNGRHICSNGKEMFGQSFPLDSNTWRVMIELNSAQALQPIGVLESKVLGIAFIVALTALILLYFPVQFVIRPLGELQRMAYRIKEGDFSKRIKYQSEDEIGNLARTFNMMAEAIQERTMSLERTAHDLQKREVELRIQHDRLNTVVHSLTDGLVLLNSRGDVVLSNKASAPLINFLESAEAVNRIRKCKNGLSKDNNCLHCLMDVSKKTSCVIVIENATYEIISTKLPAVDGSTSKVLVSRDITERERLGERQAHQDRLSVLGKTAAVVAHEMNSPLAAISMYNQMMESELRENSKFHEHVDVIKRNTQTCQRIINELLNYAKLPQPRIEEINIRQILVNVIRFLRPLNKEKQTTIEQDFQDKDQPFLGDATQIQQVFVNLLLNALQAVPEGTGKIKLSTFHNNSGLIVDVEDNGPGVDIKHKREIFEPFFTTKNTGGTGLGLSTARSIINAHNGDLELFESIQGKTIFRVLIPFQAKA